MTRGERTIRSVLCALACLLAVLIIGFADYETGPEIGLTPFYLVPICLAAWLHGRALGLAAAIGSAIV
jgi:hypothetical protein